MSLQVSEKKAYIVNKDYMLETKLGDVVPPLLPDAEKPTSYLFVLSPSSAGGYKFTQWFVEAYKAKGLTFDRILVWDPTLLHPSEEIFKPMPSEVINSLSFYNMPVDEKMTSKFNPLRTLRGLCSPRDFVVFAMPGEKFTLQKKILSQIRENKETMTLIDELYVDLHPSKPLVLNVAESDPVSKFLREKKPSRRSFFFDLGASTYSAGMGGASQQWFVDGYTRRGIKFDRILAWEATLMFPSTVFEGMPAEVLDSVSYFNIPAETEPEATNNPLRILAEITNPEDFVVIKIDIDNSEVESSFLSQILSDRQISSRIDELYYEHHVTYSPVQWYFWKWSVDTGATLIESHKNFTALRQLGIRAHPWV